MRRVLLVLMSLLLLSGCGNNSTKNGEKLRDEDLTPVKGGEIRLFCDVPDTLNPIVTGYKSVSEVMYMVYDGLFRTENDFSATPVLSSGYTANAGNTQYTVRLKKGVKFHDGSKLDGADVVSTVEMIRSTDSKYNINISNVKSCSIQDDGSVVFNLNTAQSNFVNMLDFPIMPSELVADDYSVDNIGFTPNGTGKFKVERMEPDTLILKKYGDYHGEKPYVDSANVSYIKDMSIAKYAFEATEVDVITTDLYTWGDTSMSGDFSTFEYESNRLAYLGINCNNVVLSDKSVRRAIATAIDKSDIVSEIMYTHAATVSSPINPNAFFANNEYVHAAYERGKAKEELKANGWLDLDGDGILDKYFGDEQLSLTFTVAVNEGNPVLMKLAEYLVDNVADEGIRLSIMPLTYDLYVEAVTNAQCDMFIGRTDITNDCDLAFMLRTNSPRNYFGYSSTAMESALNNICVSDGAHNIKSAYSAFDTLFKEEYPFIPLYFETDAVFASVRLRGDINISRTGVLTGMQNAFVNYKD